MRRYLIPTLALAAASSATISAQAAPDSDVLGNDGPPPTFEKLDIDDNNRISREESKLARQLFLHFDAFDTDTDNHLSPREYEKYKDY